MNSSQSFILTFQQCGSGRPSIKTQYHKGIQFITHVTHVTHILSDNFTICQCHPQRQLNYLHSWWCDAMEIRLLRGTQYDRRISIYPIRCVGKNVSLTDLHYLSSLGPFLAFPKFYMCSCIGIWILTSRNLTSASQA